MHGREERCIQNFDGETWGKRPFGRPRCRNEYNIKLDLQEIGWGGAWTGFICLRIQKDGRFL
jgi:hypothetical protein